MTTDFSYNGKQIVSGGPFKPGGKDMPSDARTRVESYADIANIPNPHVGLKVTVKVDETNNNKMTDYIVKSLKANASGIANSVVDQVQRYVDYLGANGQGVDINNFATKEELGLKADKTELHSHINKTVLDGITSTNVDNWNNKVDKVEGKTLTTNDYTNEEKQTVASLKATVGDTSSGLVKDVKDLKINGVSQENVPTDLSLEGTTLKLKKSDGTVIGIGVELPSSEVDLSTISLEMQGQILKIKNNDTVLSSVTIPTATVTDEQLRTIIQGMINDGTLGALTIADESITKEKLSKNLTIDNQSSLQDLQLKETNILDGYTFIDGYLKIDGSISSYTDMVYTKDYIPVIENAKYLFGDGGGFGDTALCYYDKDKNYISSVAIINTVNKIITIPENIKFIRVGAIKSKYSELTIILKDTPLWDRLKNIDLDIKKSQDNGLEVPFENKTFDLNNADPEFKGAGGGTTSSITPFIDYNIFIDSISIDMVPDRTVEVYLFERSANEGNVTFTVLKKVCNLTSNEQGKGIYNFEKPLYLPKTQFLAIKNNGSLYIQNSSHSTNKYYYFTDIETNYQINYTFTKSATGFGIFIPVCEISYFTTQKGDINLPFREIEEKVYNNINSISSIQEDIINSENEIKKIKKNNYISVFFDNFNTVKEDWINTNWAIDTTNRTLKSTTSGANVQTKENCITLNRMYHADKRYLQLKIKFELDTIFDIGFKNIAEYADGNGKVRIDIANKQLEIYSGFTTKVKNISIEDFEISQDKWYLLEVERFGLNAIVRIKDFITGDFREVVYKFNDGFFFDETYVLGVVSGGNVSIKEVNVNIMNKPLVYITGDSITAHACAENGWVYNLNQDLDGNTICSARGNDSAPSIITKFETEIKYIKPTYLLWCHGHNGEGITESRVQEVQTLCDTYGIKLYINHTTCMYGDGHLTPNEMIEKLGYRGARFDIATARDFNPYPVEGDTAFRADPTLYRDNATHPNIDGNRRMYARLKIDLPELFK